MPQFYIEFTHGLTIEADNYDEAYEAAMQEASEYRLDECADVSVEDL